MAKNELEKSQYRRCDPVVPTDPVVRPRSSYRCDPVVL